MEYINGIVVYQSPLDVWRSQTGPTGRGWHYNGLDSVSKRRRLIGQSDTLITLISTRSELLSKPVTLRWPASHIHSHHNHITKAFSDPILFLPPQMTILLVGWCDTTAYRSMVILLVDNLSESVSWNSLIIYDAMNILKHIRRLEDLEAITTSWSNNDVLEVLKHIRRLEAYTTSWSSWSYNDV